MCKHSYKLNLIILRKRIITLNSTSLLSLCYWIISPRSGHCCFPHSSLLSLSTWEAFYSKFCLCICAGFSRVGIICSTETTVIYITDIYIIWHELLSHNWINHTGKTLHAFRKRGVLLWQLALGVSGNACICYLCLYAEQTSTPIQTTGTKSSQPNAGFWNGEDIWACQRSYVRKYSIGKKLRHKHTLR